MGSIRLDRYLADVHIGSRKQIKEYIREGRVRIGEAVVTRGEEHLDPEQDTVFFDDKKLEYSKQRYIMLNKPAGVVSATKDGLSKTVIGLLKNVPVRGLSPAGRLDKDTEGLLLLTDDGPLIHQLIAPSKKVDKRYEVHLKSALSDEALRRLEEGVEIGDETKTLPARARRLPEDEKGCPVIELIIHEGRFHQIKRMLHAVGNEVVYLKRLSMGPLELDPTLPPGTFRYLSATEITALKDGGGR
ncbi:MAG: rRNA pseudouridine synthase [Lachnospiraceae bacterium]|nr:rRNA pseudouridine synthase [Lachnospiraceae bacterium]